MTSIRNRLPLFLSLAANALGRVCGDEEGRAKIYENNDQSDGNNDRRDLMSAIHPLEIELSTYVKCAITTTANGSQFTCP